MAGDHRAILTTGPIPPTLARLSAQMLIGIFAMMSFNLIDTYFVGRLGTPELAAMTLTFPVVIFVSSIALGLGIGASAVISKAIGEGDDEKVKRLTTDSLFLSLVLVLAFVVAGMFTIEPLFGLMQASPEIIALVKQYLLIWYPGMLFVVVPMVGNNAIRATGDTRTPSIIMIVAVCVNAALDPILIFGWGPVPALELRGAAIATVIARASTLSVSLFVLNVRKKMLSFRLPGMHEMLESWKSILSIAVPAAGANIILPLSAFIITGMIAPYGAEVVAGYGVATRVEGFAMTVIMALFAVLGPFIGQNIGAGFKQRAIDALRHSRRFSIVWGVVMLGVLAFAGRPIAAIFDDSPQAVATASLYLLLAPIGFASQGIIRLSTAALNVLNRARESAFITAFQAILINIPLALVLKRFFGPAGIFAAYALSCIIAGGVACRATKRAFAAVPG
ncbi:MAG: MATE family efflux transporter [Chitinivibrionales bacterium]|nr:MATE family efflux transporter [Chitinivibrionales bacterium]